MLITQQGKQKHTSSAIVANNEDAVTLHFVPQADAMRTQGKSGQTREKKLFILWANR